MACYDSPMPTPTYTAYTAPATLDTAHQIILALVQTFEPKPGPFPGAELFRGALRQDFWTAFL
ncbi:MAG: hypothetical protein HC853_08295 [Anaerolineae bacterium]|nr:hypothetical protein [Anaerolineae bacterium]